MADRDGGVELGQINLSGWKAVVAIVVIVVGGGLYWWNGIKPKPAPPEVVEPLQLWISSHYNSQAMANVPTGMGLGATDREKAQLQLAARQSVAMDDVTFKSLEIRGDHDSDAVLRAEVQIKGGPAPDGKAVHYYRAEWRAISREWHVAGETNEYAWRAAAW